MRRFGRFLKIFAAFTLLLIVGAGAAYSAAKAVGAAKSSRYFLVKNVSVQGIIRADRKKVDNFAKTLVGRNMFELEPSKLSDIDDIWVEKVEIRKHFPDGVSVLVFEERPVTGVRVGKECYIATAAGTLIPDKCQGGETVVSKGTEKEHIVSFLKIYERTPAMKDSMALLKPEHFETVVDGVLYKCGYDEEIIPGTFRLYTDRIKKRYGSVKYVDMRLPGKIYVNGVRNVSG
jgi:cell division protein FtsQ